MKKLKTWETKSYYEMAKKGSLDNDHPGMKVLEELSKDAVTILDLGCGEGTRLNSICKKEAKCVGVDISDTAIGQAKKNYPHLKFINANLESLPIKNCTFDLVFSAYVLEHLHNPQKVIKEAVRVCKKRGKLVFVAPNYGSPNRVSPPFKGSRLGKTIKGVVSDFFRIFVKVKFLNWNKVDPIDNVDQFQIDQDATVEPYIGTLVAYLRSLGMKIVSKSSSWDQEMPNARFHQRIFSFAARLGLYPFYYWGPHLVVVAEK